MEIINKTLIDISLQKKKIDTKMLFRMSEHVYMLFMNGNWFLANLAI